MCGQNKNKMDLIKMFIFNFWYMNNILEDCHGVLQLNG